MESTRFSLGEMKGKVMAEHKSQNFTCEIVVLNNSNQLVAIVSFGALKRDTAMVFPLDSGTWRSSLENRAREYCAFYEKHRSSVWFDLYKGANNG